MYSKSFIKAQGSTTKLMLNNLRHADFLLFDLDGTLSDNSGGIIGGVTYALNKFGIFSDDRKSLEKFIGPPLSKSFSEFCGFSPEDVMKAVEFYRAYYREKGMFENTMYDGIPEMLDGLKAAGKKLFIATSKPEVFARRITEKFGIDGFFEYICGSEFDGSREEKCDVIGYIIDEFRLDPNRTLMIGDRHHDIEGGHVCGVSAMGVLYGFGSREELISSNADWLAETPEDILKIIL